MQCLHSIQRRVHSRGVTDDLEVGFHFEKRTEPLAQNRVVLDQENSDLFCAQRDSFRAVVGKGFGRVIVATYHTSIRPRCRAGLTYELPSPGPFPEHGWVR